MIRRGLHVSLLVTASLMDDTGYTVNTRRVIDALRNAGVALSVIQVVDRHGLASAKKWAKRDERACTVRAPLVNASPHVRRLDEFRFRLGLQLLMRRRRVDVVHARGIKAASHVAPIRTNAPLLLDVRGDAAAEMRALCGPSSPHYTRALDDQRLAFGVADAFVGVSDSMMDWILESAPRLTQVPHAMIPCSVELPRAAVSDTCNLVVYAGGFQVYQPPEEVFGQLCRVAELAGIEQVEVYTYDRSEAVGSAAAELCPQALVEYLAPDQVAGRLSRALVGVIPRVADQSNVVACPTKIAEYLAAGVPVLVSRNLGRWSERLSEWGVGCELEASDEQVARFCAAIRRDRAAMGDQCRRVAGDHFSIEAASTSLVRLYSEMVGDRG